MPIPNHLLFRKGQRVFGCNDQFIMSTKNTPKKQAVKTATEKAEDTPEANSGSPGGPDDKALIAAKMKAGLSHEAAIEVIERQRAEDAKNQTDQ